MFLYDVIVHKWSLEVWPTYVLLEKDGSDDLDVNYDVKSVSDVHRFHRKPETLTS